MKKMKWGFIPIVLVVAPLVVIGVSMNTLPARDAQDKALTIDLKGGSGLAHDSVAMNNDSLNIVPAPNVSDPTGPAWTRIEKPIPTKGMAITKNDTLNYIDDEMLCATTATAIDNTGESEGRYGYENSLTVRGCVNQGDNINTGANVPITT